MTREDVQKLLDTLFTFLEGKIQNRFAVMALEVVRAYLVNIGVDLIMDLFKANGLQVTSVKPE